MAIIKQRMNLPDLKELVLNPGTLPESVPDGNRIVLWLPGEREGGFQNWERVASIANAEITVEQGICAIPATLIRARQRIRGLLANLIQRFRSKDGDRVWLLPNGESAEQWGDRQTDILLAWPQDESDLLDEAQIKMRWPQSQQIGQIADKLFLVAGIGAPPSSSPVAEAGVSDLGHNAQLQGQPREIAEQMLTASRQTGDRRREVSALTDLGIILMGEGDAQQAATRLEEALVIARQLGDRSKESDVLGNLGMAVLAGDPAGGQKALELFQQELALARDAKDRYAEKIALEHLGLSYSRLRDPTRAFSFFEQALSLARTVGDRHQEAILLWQLGIQHADLGQRDQAVAKAQVAIDLLGTKPQADLFARYLQRYLKGDPGGGLGGSVPGVLSGSFGGSIISPGFPGQPGPGFGQDQLASGPGLLRMAVSAVRSMTRFVGSGFKTASAETTQKRLWTCSACEHYTGLRCRICGCFTNVKARMLQEDCPIGKWPA
jgi:tetratricopeptide (TPR) repeat protein